MRAGGGTGGTRSLVPNQRQRDARVHGDVSAQRCRELRFGCDHPGIGEERLVSAEQNIATVKAIYDDPQVAADPVLKAFKQQVDVAVPMPNSGVWRSASTGA